MTENNKLQELLDSFSLGLREYIKDEVSRQVAQATSAMEVEEEEADVVGVTTGTVASVTNVPTIDIQASLNKLAELVKTNEDSVSNNSAIEELVSKYGNLGSVIENRQVGLDGSEIEQVSQEPINQMPDVIGSVAENMSTSKVSGQESGFSVIQGLLDKIRQRKNIANN